MTKAHNESGAYLSYLFRKRDPKHLRSDPGLTEFVEFCLAHPELRFWQALYAFTNAEAIQVDGRDPFYWEVIKP